MGCLYILVFPVGPFVPNAAAHWALYLPPEDGSNIGRWYTVQKESVVASGQPKYWNGAYVLTTNVLAVPLQHIYVSQAQLHAICENVTNDVNRPAFNLFTQNCQHWVIDVVSAVEQALGRVQRADVRALLRGYGY